MKNEIKESAIVGVSISSFITGVILTFVGLFLPERGDITGNVLIAIGQFLTLSAAGLGLKEYVDGSITKAQIKAKENNE